MAIGKNKRISKGGKKGNKKKVTDPFSRKEWYLVKAPTLFKVTSIGNTLVSRTQGTKLATDGLMNRVYEVNLADLQQDEDQGFRKIKLSCENVEGKTCYCDFHGMDITRDYLCSLIRKWHTMIEASVDVRTQDGYQLRMFCIGFTKTTKTAFHKVTCYAQASQVRAIRAKMVEIMTAEASKVQLRELVKKFIPESIGKLIQKAGSKIYPLDHVHIRKVKVLKKPKTDVARLMEIHETSTVGGVATAENVEAANLLTQDMKA